MPNNMKIDYVELPAENFDVVEAFYRQVFSWTFEDYGPEYRAFSDGQVDGGFYRSNLKSRTGNGAALIIFYAEDLELVQASIEKAGGSILQPIFSFPGGRRFQFADPAGNELAVWSDK